MTKIAIFRVRGRVNVRYDIKKTLEYLKLKYKHNCNIVDDTPEYRGMIEKVKDYVTYGEISKETFKKLLLKRGKTKTGKRITDEILKPKFSSVDDFVEKFFNNQATLKDIDLNLPFRLNSPSGGFERKGIKIPYSLGGALGYRGDKINELLEKTM
ncbi:MAG: 50S ribosomal protein L30 [Candidatus Altarchaeaceae archaeon]